MINIDDAFRRAIGVPSHLAAAQISLLTLGVPFLDEALVGIVPTDLVLIGAKTGRGKSQLCVDIASSVSSRGKRVLFIALEAEQDEVEMRLLYQLESGLYFQDPERDRGVHVSYRSWRLGALCTAFFKYRIQAMEVFRTRYQTLRTVYRNEAFGYDQLMEVLERVEGQVDLVVLDHLHYFDLDHSRESGNEKLSRLIKNIRALNLFHNVPFVVAAHVRKDVEGILPVTEDFMGTSDIGKNSTVCVMIAPKPDGYDARNQISETLISVAKARTGGLGNLCGVLYYSVTHQRYLPQFKLARVVGKNDKVTMLKDEEYPTWAHPKTLTTVR